jgi:L-alanine-DL-glutamate epimerase-like enolase superfamily enzyme
MRISDVRVAPLDLALEEPFKISLGTQTVAENVLVALETEDGTVGYGEGSPIAPVTGETQAGTVATARAAAGLLEGEDLADHRVRVREVRETFPGAVSATLAIETALLDAYCRVRGLPLAALFGGDPAPVETDLTIPIVEPDAARETACRAADRGFDHLKVKTGSDVIADVERVAAVREGAPDTEIKIDANQGWTPAETVRFADGCADHCIDLALIEQPVRADDVAGLARTRDAVSVPIAADETVFTPADAVRVVRADAADVINLKIGKSGLLGVREIVAIAEAANLELMIGCMLESAIGIHAAAHVVAGTGAFSYVDLDGNLLLDEDVAAVDHGPLIEPTGPGHGIEPDGVIGE